MWLGLAGALLLFLLSRRVLLGYPAPPPGLRSLTRIGHAVVRAAGDASFPAGGAIERSSAEAGVPMHVDRFISAQPAHMRVLVNLLFLLIEHATLIFPPPGGRGYLRFSALSPAQQIAYLVGWQTSDLFARRVVFSSLRALLTMGYFADPGVLDALSLGPRAIPSPIIEADLLWPRIGADRGSIRFTAADLGRLENRVPARAAETRAAPSRVGDT